MTKTYLETGQDYELFVDFEKYTVSIEGNFLGEERSVRNQGGDLWNQTLDYLVSKGTEFYKDTILRDTIGGEKTRQELEGGIVIETNTSQRI